MAYPALPCGEVPMEMLCEKAIPVEEQNKTKDKKIRMKSSS
jgi:hypothetical protein